MGRVDVQGVWVWLVVSTFSGQLRVGAPHCPSHLSLC